MFIEIFQQSFRIMEFSKKRKREETFEATTDVVPIPRFSQMCIKREILLRISQQGFQRPSAIQQRGILPIIGQRDLLIRAGKGTGKTTMVAIAACEIVDTSKIKVQALILSSTRVLATQSEQAILGIGGSTAIKSLACIGGRKLGTDISKLAAGVHIVCGTLHRINKLIAGGYLRTSAIKLLVFDGFDKMVNSRYKDLISDIVNHPKCSPSVVLISTTFPKEALELAHTFVDHPVRIDVNHLPWSKEGVEQFGIDVSEESKFDTLRRLFRILAERLPCIQVVIFCSSQKVKGLTRDMSSEEFLVSSMNGGMRQEERDVIMADFRKWNSSVLITDVWSRGLDVQQVNLVIHYDFPKSKVYAERVGLFFCFARTKGAIINFLTKKCVTNLEKFNEDFKHIKLDEIPEKVAHLL